MKPVTLVLAGLAGTAVGFAPAGVTGPRVVSRWAGGQQAALSARARARACAAGPVYMSSAEKEKEEEEEEEEEDLDKYDFPDEDDESDPNPWPTFEDNGILYPDTPMSRKFHHLRGVPVKTVSDTMSVFYDTYVYPIMPQYRTLVTDILHMTHFFRVDARFNYNPLFGWGFHHTVFTFLRNYPGEGKKEAIYDAMCTALELDGKQMAEDAQRMKDWLVGKTEEDILAVFRGEGEKDFVWDIFMEAREGVGPFGIKPGGGGNTDIWFLYNRYWGLGVFLMMEAVGLEPNEALIDKWWQPLKQPSIKPTKDLDVYQETLGKLEQAEQLYREVEIREKKRAADRLEDKARRAMEEAEMAEEEAVEEAAIVAEEKALMEQEKADAEAKRQARLEAMREESEAK